MAEYWQNTSRLLVEYWQNAGRILAKYWQIGSKYEVIDGNM